MRADFHPMPFIIGIIVGITITAILLWLNYKKATREKRYDERYNNLQYQSRAVAWSVSALTLVIAFGVLYIMQGFSLATIIVLLVYIIHLLTQFFMYLYMKKRY